MKKKMNLLKKFLMLSDPSSNFKEELSCYLKAILGMTFLILGILLIFHPLLMKITILGVLETGLTPTAVGIVQFSRSFLWPSGYLGSFMGGFGCLLISLYLFWRIRLIRKALKLDRK